MLVSFCFNVPTFFMFCANNESNEINKNTVILFNMFITHPNLFYAISDWIDKLIFYLSILSILLL